MTYVPDLIRVKRDGGELTEDQIGELVTGIADGSVSDAQVGALAMAIVLQRDDRPPSGSRSPAPCATPATCSTGRTPACPARRSTSTRPAAWATR